jgi:hypothetical protein
MAELEEKGLIEETDFSATRAFEVEEWDDLGLNYKAVFSTGSGQQPERTKSDAFTRSGCGRI